ncbi:FMN-dependent dehydrogenase [Pandoraea terrae]|uniref:FMN-dependent dehydrogenase n=1 Tax=Pandoraea terrae TaxID=1537710 RepID=A0A5E4V101_9BURK|nr:FMN-dependent dehydrogenase [Pandoraea terrae]
MLSNVLEYRAAAKRFLPSFAYWYLEGGAEDEVSMRRNREAYGEVFFTPRVFVDVTDVSTAVRVAGRELGWPVVVGPTGLNGLFRHRADELLAKHANAAGVPFVLSTASTSLIETVRETTNGDL